MVTDRVVYIGELTYLALTIVESVLSKHRIFTVQSFLFSSENLNSDLVGLCIVFSGTSNWSENYFTQTAGVGLVVNQTGSAAEKGQQTVQNQLQKIFQRDWNSDFAQEPTDDLLEHCSRRAKTF